MRAATGDVAGSISTGWWRTWRAGGMWMVEEGLPPWMRYCLVSHVWSVLLITSQSPALKPAPLKGPELGRSYKVNEKGGKQNSSCVSLKYGLEKGVFLHENCGGPNSLFSCGATKSNVLKLFPNWNAMGKTKLRSTEFCFANLKHGFTFDALSPFRSSILKVDAGIFNGIWNFLLQND